MENTYPTGSAVLDRFLYGGFEKDIITTVYGPAGSGKTNVCLLFSASLAEQGKKVIYVDSENNFSVERFKQIKPRHTADLLSRIIFLKPMTFQEQKEVFDKMRGLIDDSLGAIIVDSISMLYRLEIGQNAHVYEVNKDLGQQISFLSEITRRHHLPVLLTNQVYQSFEEREKVNMVGGDILRYGSKCLIELQKYRNGLRKAILQKHRSLPEGKEVIFKIVEQGFEEEKMDEKKERKNLSIV